MKKLALVLGLVLTLAVGSYATRYTYTVTDEQGITHPVDLNAVSKSKEIDFRDIRIQIIKDSERDDAIVNGVEQKGDIEIGKKLYEKDCAACHGMKGEKVIMGADNIEIRGDKYTPSLRGLKELLLREDIYIFIYNGLDNLMPAYGNKLTHNQIFSLILYIELLSQK
ncbi:MAG: cytochrome c [Deferribacteraceae bacterium]|jgi:mono/diheme cytochrome c family protein|nr:cytochrome c [Deferribacteraceae bacterium]